MCTPGGSAEERERPGVRGAWAGSQPGVFARLPCSSSSALAWEAVAPFSGEPAKQIGQQTGDLCGVETARVSLTVYPAVFLKTEIGLRVTAAVSYWFWLREFGEGVPHSFSLHWAGGSCRNVSPPAAPSQEG